MVMLLVAVFSLPLIAPLLASGPDDSSLPACCRRNGKHHCALADLTIAASSKYTTVSEKCPWTPFTRASLMLPHGWALQASAVWTGRASGPAAAIGEAEAGYRISADRTRRKRGPPALLAL